MGEDTIGKLSKILSNLSASNWEISNLYAAPLRHVAVLGTNLELGNTRWDTYCLLISSLDGEFCRPHSDLWLIGGATYNRLNTWAGSTCCTCGMN